MTKRHHREQPTALSRLDRFIADMRQFVASFPREIHVVIDLEARRRAELDVERMKNLREYGGCAD